MPKQFHNANRKICSQTDLDCIIGAITRRGVSDKQLAAYLYNNYYDFAKSEDRVGRTALHMAASCGRTQLCLWLINVAGANVNARDHESGYTSLQRALFHGHINTSVRLLQLCPEVWWSTDREGLTPIGLVTKDRPREVVLSPQLPSQVYIWGVNHNYTLGTGTNNARKLPELLDNFRNKCISIRKVWMNEFHSVFLTSSQEVWGCGHGQGGRLGVGTEKHVLTPKRFRTGGEPCLSASVALNHTLLLLASGTVLACGQNDFYQLGVSPYSKECLHPRPVCLSALPKTFGPIEGICTAKYHSVFYTTQGILSCGLNGGQLGQSYFPNDPFVKLPTLVSANIKGGAVITHVASSTGCTVFSLSSGDIYTLHQFQCRKIASRQLDIKQLAVIGGTLQSKIISGGSDPLKVSVLTSGGIVLIWQDSSPHLIRCMFGLSRLICINSIFLNDVQILFTTNEGEAYRGIIGQIEKQIVSPSQEDKSGFHKFIKKKECYHISTERIPNVHRALSITSDPKGKNFAVIQVHPQSALTEIPVHTPTNMTKQLNALFEEVSEMDALHDIVFKIQGHKFPAHRYIVACNESTFLEEKHRDNTIIIEDIHPFIFKHILKFFYTGHCDFIEPGCFLELNSVKCDPVKLMTEACSKYKISSLHQKIVCFRYEDGYVKLKDKLPNVCLEPPKFRRDLFTQLYDVQVASEDGARYQAHKCIMAARLDYFHSMLMGGWLETERTPLLHLQCSATVLETFLDFIYTNEISSSLDACDQEHVVRLLVLGDQLLFTSLREACELALVRFLNLKNAATMLQLASLHNANQLKISVLQFISLNLNTILENRILEVLPDDILLELSNYYRDFNSVHYDKRIITPYSEYTVPEQVILSFSDLFWPDHIEEIKNKETKDISNRKLACSQTVKKKTPNSNKPVTPTPEPVIIKAPVISPKEIPSFNITPSPPQNEDSLFNSYNFPSLDSYYSTTPNKAHRRPSQEIKRVFFPKISQKKKRLSQEFDEKGIKETLVKPTSQFKGWAIPSPPEKRPEKEETFNLSPSCVTSFVEIIASEQREKDNLFKMKAKPFGLTQLEDKAMEDLREFYNAVNIFDERIIVERVVAVNVAKPTWVTSHKKLF